MTSAYETIHLIQPAIMDGMRGKGGLFDEIFGNLERLSHQLYVYADGDSETQPEGSKIHLINPVGEIRCNNNTDGPAKVKIHVSKSNCIPLVKEVWVTW